MEEELRDPKNEWLKCSLNVEYFVHEYCYIYNATDRVWLPFRLWPAQVEVLQALSENRLLTVLKARQLGLSWLVLCYVLWHMLFHPAATALLFSKRDDEAVDLLDFRLKGICQRLPAWMQAKFVETDSAHEWRLSNGSAAMGFPTTGGRAYTGSIVVVDEADFVQDLDGLLNAVQPAIDAGGQMIMVSTVDKSKPASAFKRIYRAAKAKLTDWVSVFLPWYSRPGRDAAWYAARAADVMARTGSLDDLHQEYPATDTEALAARTLDKRIPAMWIEACYTEVDPIDDMAAPSIPGLVIYRQPEQFRAYVLGLDSAEGNPTSDDSAGTMVDVLTGEEVAKLRGKIQPSTLGEYAILLALYYNNAGIMCERNNHGHAVIQYIDEHSSLHLLRGYDDKPGWLSNRLGKALMYNVGADTFRQGAKDGAVLIHSEDTYTQLASIEGSTLLAPKGEMDDLADSYVLAQVGRGAAAPASEMRQAQVVGRPATTRRATARRAR